MRRVMMLAAAAAFLTAAEADLAAQVMTKAPKTTPTISKSETKAEAQQAQVSKAGRVIVKEDDRKRRDDDRYGDYSDRRRRDRDNDDDYYDDDRTYSRSNAKRNGPKFCQNGAGHPTKGRQWCEEKGYGNGNWSRATWDDVIFRTPQKDTRQLNRGGLIDVLGSVMVGRLDARSRSLGYRMPVTGQWMVIDGASVLRVLAGNTPVAELVDRNRDRRTDMILLRRS